MVEVLNAMNYGASAVGNHEFDFGLEALKRRAIKADYHYLSANTRWRESYTEETIFMGLQNIIPTAMTPAQIIDNRFWIG